MLLGSSPLVVVGAAAGIASAAAVAFYWRRSLQSGRRHQTIRAHALTGERFWLGSMCVREREGKTNRETERESESASVCEK